MDEGTVPHLNTAGCTHGSPGAPDVEVRTASLSLGGQLFIWSIRRWRDAMTQRESLDDALAYTYGVAGCPEAIPLVDEVMSLVAVAAFRPFTIRCVRCQTLSGDEWALLRAAQSLQSGHPERARTFVGTIVAGRLGHAFCRSAKPYVDALAVAGVFLKGANLRAVQ